MRHPSHKHVCTGPPWGSQRNNENGRSTQAGLQPCWAAGAEGPPPPPAVQAGGQELGVRGGWEAAQRLSVHSGGHVLPWLVGLLEPGWAWGAGTLGPGGGASSESRAGR